MNRAADDDPRVARARALADPTRRRVLGIVLDSPGQRAMVTRIADELALRQPTVSHHMRVLADAGLVTGERSGRTTWYRLSPDVVDEVADALGWRAPPEAPLARDRVVHDLRERFPLAPQDEVVDVVDDSLARLTGLMGARDAAPLAARFAADRLEARGADAAPRTGADPKPTVLFVCVRNAGRSQIAAAILRQLAGDRVRVRTAGSDPAARIGGRIVSALSEIGVPLLDDFPKPLTDDMVRAADVVVTMGCGDACPVFPGIRYLDWPLDDPADAPLDDVRGIRDEIDARVRGLLHDLALPNQ